MKFSKSELMVLEVLWNADNLDENGEIIAADLSQLLAEKYGWAKTSNYTYFGRLLNKGAIQRRYPKYTLRPVITREEVGLAQAEKLIKESFHGSFLYLFTVFLQHNMIDKGDIEKIRKLLDEYELD